MPPDDASEGMPEGWRHYFSIASGDTLDGWAAALQRSTIGYAVLHGPPALTRIVREHLRDAEGVAFLGRLFDPRRGDQDEGSAPNGSQLDQSDRPRFLTHLLARAEGFPVIEVCLGDEPVGESYLLHDENALFVSCQPDHAHDDDRRRLYWALAAAADRAKVRDLRHVDRRHASLLRVRNEVDAFIDAFVSTDHRKQVSETLLGASVPPQVLRLATGTADRVAAGEPIAHALARLRRGLGPAFRPMLKGLAEIDKTLGAVTLADLTLEFPPEWRDYFSTSAAPTFEHWEAALSPLNGLYGVLYGPPAATATVRTHLAGRQGVRMLGRVFDPDETAKAAASPQTARQTLKRVEDRPLALAQALARADGFPVIEVCPGDERHGEEFFLSDANALILSCEPLDRDDADQTALYWALVATGNRAASRELGSVADDGLGPRQRLNAFVARKVLGSHREWFGETVLFAENDHRIVRLSWGGARGAGERAELLQARLARLSNAVGPDAAPLAEALAGLENPLAEQSLESLVACLPYEWRQLFVVSVEAEEKVA
jgi:hypothetical protein